MREYWLNWKRMRRYTSRTDTLCKGCRKLEKTMLQKGFASHPGLYIGTQGLNKVLRGCMKATFGSM